MSPNLGLNEALVVINKENITGSLELLHQVEECFGCPLTPLKAADEEDKNQFVVDTKHNVLLELRQLENGAFNSSCKLYGLALNSKAQYRIDVSKEASSGGSLKCELKTLDNGECLLCPFAILICFLFAIMAAEQVYAKFWAKRRPDGASSTGQKSNMDNLVDELDQTAVNAHESNVPEAESQVGDRNLAAQIDATGSPSTSKMTIVDDSAQLKQAPKSSSQRRVECLDVFRGLTLAGMIFVNYGGAGYTIWDHKPWDGITLADFVFPFFIFSMGSSIAISMKSLVRHHDSTLYQIAGKIFSRSCVLFLLGICLNSKNVNYEQADGLAKLRLTGVLQRFSISYLAIAFMYLIELTLSEWTKAQSLLNVPYLSKFIGVFFELLTAINYTSIYVYLTFFFQYDTSNNCPIGYIGPGGQTQGGQYANCTGGSAAWLDRSLLGENHLYNDHEVRQIFRTQITHDPEGILGYTTSIVLTLIGLQCGKILSCKRQQKSKLISLGKWILALAISCSLIYAIPINKRLWSLTFILITALAAFLLVTAFYLLIDVSYCKKAFLIELLSSAGKNSIFLYVAHSLINGMLPWWFPVEDPTSHMHLLFRLTWSTLVWLLIAHYMALKGLFIKI